MNVPAPSTNVALWREYRRAFEEFARKARIVQSLKEGAGPARASIDDALLELERARLHYNNCRDALAAALRPGSNLAPMASGDHVGQSGSWRGCSGISKTGATAAPTTTGIAPRKSFGRPRPKRLPASASLEPML